MSQGKIFSSF